MSLNHKKLLPPPWLAYPEIERYSIGWRMGYGEDYLYKFSDWFYSLPEEEQIKYRDMFPEPVTWAGWWNDTDDTNILEHGNFIAALWTPDGNPKYTLPWLQRTTAEGQRHKFCFFWGHQPANDGTVTKSCFSQWWMADFNAMEQTYCCMEQYIMAGKAELFDDKETRGKILASRSPKQIKELGRRVKGFEQATWDKAKFSIVLNGNWCKFSQNMELKAFLLSTGDAILAEASPYDGIWGIRMQADAPDAVNPLKWRGQNLLGFALMEVRDELRRVTKYESLCEHSARNQSNSKLAK